MYTREQKTLLGKGGKGMSFWGNWSWLYFVGGIIIIIGIIGRSIFKWEAGLSWHDFFADIIGLGVAVSVVCLVAFLINLYDYHDQKKLYESGYSCIINFNEENKELMKTNRADVLKKAVEINENYFEITDGEMKVKEYSFRYIKDEKWRELKPINTNEIMKKIENLH